MDRRPLHRRNYVQYLQARTEYDQPVVLKEAAHQPPTRSHLDQLHNEHTITKQLADVPGVHPALAKEGTESRLVLLLEYIQGQPASELIRTASLDLSEKLRIAVDVAGIVSHVHAQQVMHKDINSNNILMADV